MFGEVLDGKMRLSAAGEAARQFWAEIPEHFPHVKLDAFIVMPNHVHGIVAIERDASVETRHVASLRSKAGNRFGPLPSGSLQAVIHAYKASVTRWCRKEGHDGFAWQPRFYEHIIKSESSLDAIRQYIADNPGKWSEDKNNPLNMKG
jgi:REP element-mobilizing transposase RayT